MMMMMMMVDGKDQKMMVDSVVDVEMMTVMMVDRCCVRCWFPLFRSRKKYLSPPPAQRPTNMMGWPMIFLPEGS